MASPGDELLIGVHKSGEEVVLGENNDDGHVHVDEDEDAVFVLARHDGFAVEGGGLFHSERACTCMSAAAATLH